MGTDEQCRCHTAAVYGLHNMKVKFKKNYGRFLLTTSLLEVKRFRRGVKLYAANGNDDGANRRQAE